MRTVFLPYPAGLGAALLALLALASSACERPFVEISTPSIEVVAPDLSTVLLQSSVEISVSARSFRPVESVRVNGLPMTFDREHALWTATFDLTRGLNTLVIEASDVDDIAGTDTAYAVFLPFRYVQNGPSLPEPRGGHTTTALNDDYLLATGGASEVGGPAHGDAFLLRPGGSRFVMLNDTLRVARTGHTATLLPDGRVLILGGSRTDDVDGISDLVETAEIYDPDQSRFSAIPVDGQPIRRTLHTAVLRNAASGVFVDLYGGRGDIRYGADPRLGTRRDLRTFELVNDTLFALNTLLSAPFLETAISGHTETQVQPGVHVVFGSFFDLQLADEASFQIDYNAPPDFIITDVPPLRMPRTRHAAGTVAGRFVAISGGRQASPAGIVDENELYSIQAGRLFTLPNTRPFVKRFGHTATNLAADRILLLGGFTPNGNSLALSEFFVVSFGN